MSDPDILSRITVVVVGENPCSTEHGGCYSPCQWDECGKHGFSYEGRHNERIISTEMNPVGGGMFTTGTMIVWACCEKHAKFAFGKVLAIRSILGVKTKVGPKPGDVVYADDAGRITDIPNGRPPFGFAMSEPKGDGTIMVQTGTTTRVFLME